MSADFVIPSLAAAGHSAHCNRCLSGLPFSQISVESTKLALVFYCLGTLDLNSRDPPDSMTKEQERKDRRQREDWRRREDWRHFIWGLQASGPYGTGFKPSFYMTSENGDPTEGYSDYDTPHMIVTYTALLSLAVLRDEFAALDRPGLLKFLRSSQKEDGSFTTDPTGGDTDLRLTYCAFVISTLLDDWSGVDVEKAVHFVRRCRTYEGGYGQAPGCEAQGSGPTYLALASLRLATPPESQFLTPTERRQTIRWLIQNQDSSGGFRGRTNKEADACYCFWCGAAIEILGESGLVNSVALASFLGRCQCNFGGIAKAPEDDPDPYHTYLSLAALSIIPPPLEASDSTWKFEPFDPLVITTKATAQWARNWIRKG